MVDRIISFSVKYPLDMVSYLVILIPFVIGLTRYERLQKENRAFVYYFLVVFLKETAGLAIMLSGNTNLYLHNVQAFIDIIFLWVAYRYVLQDRKCRTYLATAGTVCLIMAALFFNAQNVDSINQIAARLFAIVAVLLFFNDLLSQLRVVHLSRYAMFWLSSGLLIYATSTFLIALFSQFLFSANLSAETFDFFWNTQQGLFILFCLFASLGFWVSRSENQQAVL